MGCGMCVAAPVKSCFHRWVPASHDFCCGGFQVSLWHVGWDARYNINYYINSCNFSWILQKCISFFFLFFFPCNAQLPVIRRHFMRVCACGEWVICTVKFLVFMRSDKNGKCTPRRPGKQKANKRNIMLTWKLKGSWKKKCFDFGAFQYMFFFCKLAIDHNGLV